MMKCIVVLTFTFVLAFAPPLTLSPPSVPPERPTETSDPPLTLTRPEMLSVEFKFTVS